jgi:ArsR family transcriptional regulator, cadmium/lead-responsive transcriptional repressor
MPMRSGARTDLARGAKFFRSLGDPTRLAILQVLAEGEHRVGDLVSELGTSQPNISGHLACLKDCGLVLDRPQGRAVYYSLAVPALFDVLRSAETLLSSVGDEIELCPNFPTQGRRAGVRPPEQGR